MNTKYLLSELEDKIVDTISSYLQKNKLEDYSIVMSGGFDSGLLAALTKPRRAYRIVFPYGSRFDESRYADAIAKHLDVMVTEHEITPEGFKASFEKAVKIFGEPTHHFSLVPLYMLFEFLSEMGETDVLSGEGPDEYLGGYARQIIFDELKKLYEIPELRNYHGIIDKVLGISAQWTDWKEALEDKYVDLVGYEFSKLYSQYPLQGALGKIDMECGHIEKMEQKFAKHFGINFHYPYINKEFAEYCYKLPDDIKIRNGVTKWGFRQIAMKYLPEVMRDRAKMGGPVAPVNKLMGWDLPDFDKSRYIKEQEKILNGKNPVQKS